MNWGGSGERRSELEVLKCCEQAVVVPFIVAEADEGGKCGVAGKQVIDAGEVLDGRMDETKKRKVL